MTRTFVVDVSHAPAPFHEVCQTEQRGAILFDIYMNGKYEVVRTFFPNVKWKEDSQGQVVSDEAVDKALARAKKYALKISGQKRVKVI